MRWQLRIKYEWWAWAIRCTYGRENWNWNRFHQFRDQFQEDMDDMIGMYCAGGEL